eukprot:GFYU01009186.1.p1 GENE.GFYU01009186.1~~GFYU01009186.1.p1  ORF type:complete len:462 (+),score=129.02 GFYU01009186.1:39-1388(+)
MSGNKDKDKEKEKSKDVAKDKEVKDEKPDDAAAAKDIKQEGGAAAVGATGEVPAVKLPLDVGTKAMMWWNNGWHEGEIIERRKNDAKGPDVYDYYVHYTQFNRRLDEWVSLDKMDLKTVKTRETEEKKKQDGRKVTRTQKKKTFDESHPNYAGDGHDELDPESLKEHEEFTKVKNIQKIEIGKWAVDTWYFSPFPKEYVNCDTLFFCEFCLKFFKRRESLVRHAKKCDLKHPPGDEIYRNGNVSFFEVDGTKQKIYCQNLCYMAKLFLDHKTLYYDVDPFLFYILCECDEKGCHIVGYFSKEKDSEDGYNLACILTFPQFQRMGYGKILISFSYELSKKEGKVGTPERPLSDLGLVSYRSYWGKVLLEILKKHKGTISIKDLSEVTCFKPEDIIGTLQSLGLITYRKGQHVIALTPKQLDGHLKPLMTKKFPMVDPAKLIWTPYTVQKH